MFCKNCGFEMASGTSFCTRCGTPVEAPAASENQDVSVAASQPSVQVPPAGGYAQQNYQAPQAAPQQVPQQVPYSVNVYTAGSGAGNANGGVAPGATYPVSDKDQTLRLIAFILAVISTVCGALAIIPLAWMIPMTVHVWGIYKGKKPNTTAFGVCTLIFLNIVGGILLLVSEKDN